MQETMDNLKRGLRAAADDIKAAVTDVVDRLEPPMAKIAASTGDYIDALGSAFTDKPATKAMTPADEAEAVLWYLARGWQVGVDSAVPMDLMTEELRNAAWTCTRTRPPLDGKWTGPTALSAIRASLLELCEKYPNIGAGGPLSEPPAGQPVQQPTAPAATSAGSERVDLVDRMRNALQNLRPYLSEALSHGDGMARKLASDCLTRLDALCVEAARDPLPLQQSSATAGASRPSLNRMLTLIGDYWDLAYAEGLAGRTTDTVDGAASTKYNEIRAELRALAGLAVAPDARAKPAFDEWSEEAFDAEHAFFAWKQDVIGSAGAFLETTNKQSYLAGYLDRAAATGFMKRPKSGVAVLVSMPVPMTDVMMEAGIKAFRWEHAFLDGSVLPVHVEKVYNAIVAHRPGTALARVQELRDEIKAKTADLGNPDTSDIDPEQLALAQQAVDAHAAKRKETDGSLDGQGEQA